MDSNLAAAIDDLVEKRTFGLDALEAIKGLRDRALKLDAKLDERDGMIKAHEARIFDLNKTNADLHREVNSLKTREAEVAAREAKMNQIEKDSAVAQAKAQTFESVFGTIFRNTTVRENTVRSVPQMVTQPGGYQAQQMMTETGAVERKSE